MALRIIFKGRVQGVGFRYFILKQAKKYNLFGWVKNSYDGSVIAEVLGEKDLLENFIGDCKKGNSMSIITEINIFVIPDFESDKFEIKQ